MINLLSLFIHHDEGLGGGGWWGGLLAVYKSGLLKEVIFPPETNSPSSNVFVISYSHSYHYFRFI